MRNIILYLFVGILFISCSQTDSNDQANSTSETNNESTNSSESAPANQAKLPYFILDSYKDSLGQTSSIVSISMNGQNIEVSKAIVECTPIEKSEFKKYQIPPGASEAYGGFRNGRGEYFFLMENENSNFYMVMYSAVTDPDDASQFNYSSLMNFTYQTK